MVLWTMLAVISSVFSGVANSRVVEVETQKNGGWGWQRVIVSFPGAVKSVHARILQNSF